MKQVITLVLGLGMALVANANLIFWQVATTGNSTDGYTATTVASGSNPISYSYAKIYTAGNADGTDGSAVSTYVSTAGGQATSVAKIYASDANNDVLAYVDTSSISTQYIWIELFNADDSFAGMGDVTLLSTLTTYESVADFSSKWTMANGVWGGGTYTTAPEPTSGLLMLIGAALLGLKRRKVA